MSWEAPRSWPSSNCSSPTTRVPAPRQLPRRSALPSAPSPTTTYVERSQPSRRPRSQPRQQPAPDVGAVVLHRREPAVRVGPRGHAALHRLADRPVLPVDQVPEVAGVGRVEAGVARPRRRANSRSHSIGCGRRPAAAARTPRRGRPSRTASGWGRPARPCAAPARPRRARAAARGSVVPDIVNVQAPSRCGMPSSQSRPVPPPPNAGTSRDELGVHRAAVVALVVVLGDDLPVGRHVVGAASGR